MPYGRGWELIEPEAFFESVVREVANDPRVEDMLEGLSFALIMAEGREQAEEAMVDVAALRKAQVELYLSKLDECHLRDRRDRLSDPLRRWAGLAIPEPEKKIPV